MTNMITNRMKSLEDNPGIQKRRKRRKSTCSLMIVKNSIRLRSFEQLLFVIALTFANQICDIQSTPATSQLQGTSNELSAAPDNQQSAGGHDRSLVEEAALVGQPTDLSCILDETVSPVWQRNGFTISQGSGIVSPFDRRYSLPEFAGNQHPDLSSPQRSARPINYTLHISRTTMADDQTTFACSPFQTGAKSRFIRLSVWQPPTRVDVVAKIEDTSSVSSGPQQPADLLLASVVPDKQDGQQAAPNEEEQITRIIVRQNTRLRLECNSDASKPEPKLVWFDHQHRPVQDTFNLSDGGGKSDSGSFDPESQDERQSSRKKQQLFEASTLVWSFVVQRHHNDHIFTCQADHPAFQDSQRFPHLFGRQPRHRIRLEVQYEPEISLTKDQLQARENKPIKFRCEARARPNLLTYRWYIDDKPILNATSNELQISRLTRQMNQREVRCQVSNEVGSNSAIMRLSVNYSPAFVSHLLPVSLQPQTQLLAHDWADSSTTNRQPDDSRRLAGFKRHEIVLARQLAIGAEPNQDLELRCDFDGHPRVHSVQWFKLETEYSIMGNVTPADSEGLIQRGALYASFRYPESYRVPAGSDDEAELETGSELQEIDYEQMSIEELAMIDAEANNQAQNSSQVPMLEQIVNQVPSPTSTVIFEPLDWTVSEEPPMSSSSLSSLEDIANPDQRHHAHQRARPNPHPQLHQHRPMAQQLPRQSQPQQQHLITTLSLSTRNFGSDEIESSSVHSSRDRLNWRSAEVASSKLHLKQVNVDSVGKYVCRAKSVLTENGDQHHYTVARAVYLVLREKPRIISHPLQTAQIGQKLISVECLAQINTVVDNSTQIQWFKDGKLIEDTSTTVADLATGGISSRNISIIVDRSPDLLFIRSRLRIRAPTYSDFGVYNCTISNSYGVPDSMAINLQPTATTGLLFRAIAAIGILSILVLGCTITCLLAFSPQRRKMAADNQDKKLNGMTAKVSSLNDSKLISGRDQLDSGATTATASSQGSDTDSLRKSQTSSDQPTTTLSEAPAFEDPSAHLFRTTSGATTTNGAPVVAPPQQGAPFHFMQPEGYLHQQTNDQMIYQHHSNEHHLQQQPQPARMANGWSSMERKHGFAYDHYQMPSSVLAQQPPPLPPPPPPANCNAAQVALASGTLIVESPYVSNGRTYYSSPNNNGGHYATTNNRSSSQMMVTTDGEAQFESQYGSMISNAYRALGYSTTSSPSSGGSSSASGLINPPVQMVAFAGQQHLLNHHQHPSSNSTSSSPNSMTTYHNLQSGGFVSQLSLQADHNHSPPSSDILLMKSAKTTSDNQILQESESYIAASNKKSPINNGLATHV